MSTPNAASSAYFRIPRFSKGDLEEVMLSLRPHEITEISDDLAGKDLPYFPFPAISDIDWHDSKI